MRKLFSDSDFFFTLFHLMNDRSERNQVSSRVLFGILISTNLAIRQEPELLAFLPRKHIRGVRETGRTLEIRGICRVSRWPVKKKKKIEEIKRRGDVQTRFLHTALARFLEILIVRGKMAVCRDISEARCNV